MLKKLAQMTNPAVYVQRQSEAVAEREAFRSQYPVRLLSLKLYAHLCGHAALTLSPSP
jgi:hypothetical protein